MSSIVTTTDIVAHYRPHRERKQLFMYSLFGSLYAKPNKTNSIYSRAADSFRRLDDSIIFLAGILTLLPHLGLKRAVQLQHDGEKLATEASAFLSSFGEPSVAKVRKLRVFNERIVGFIEKVEKDLPRRRLPDLAKLLSPE